MSILSTDKDIHVVIVIFLQLLTSHSGQSRLFDGLRDAWRIGL